MDRWADPALVGLVAATVYVLHGYDGRLSRDLGLFVYGGEQVAHGVPPYVGVFNSVGPLADALPGLAIWIGNLVGADPVTAARVGFTAISAGCCVLVAVLARDVLGSRAGGYLAAAVFLTFGSFLRLASGGPREKTAMVLFLLAALVLLGRRRWVAAGVATALATLTWQPAFVVAIAVAGVALAGAPAGRWRGLAGYLLGGAATAGVAVACYAALGDLGPAIGGFWTVNADYTRQTSLVGNPGHVWPELWQGYGAGLVVLVLGLVALLVLGARAAPAAVRRDPAAVALASLAVGALAGSTWTALVVNGPPDLFELLPLGALGVAGAGLLAARLVRPPLGTGLLATAATVAVATAVVESVTTSTHGLARERADVEAVLAAAPPGATVLSVNTPEVLALAQKRNPLSYQLFDDRMRAYLDHTTPGGMAAIPAAITEARPTLLVVSRQGRWDWLRPVLARDYVRLGRGPGWTWYLLRSSGPRTYAVVRAAIDTEQHTGPARETSRAGADQ